MKKAVAMVAAGILSAAMALSFAACGEEQESVIDTAKEMSSERIGSLEAWEAAFSDPTLGASGTSYTFNNANYSIENETVAVLSGTLSSTSSRLNVQTRTQGLLVVAGEKAYDYDRTELSSEDAEQSGSATVYENYYAADETRYEHYYKDSAGNWTMSTTSSLGISLSETSAYTGSLVEYADEYDLFTWSDERQGYCKSVSFASSALLGVTVNATLTLKFREGKIAAMIISDAAVAADQDMSGLLLGDVAASVEAGVVITYGGQSVTLPEV